MCATDATGRTACARARVGLLSAQTNKRIQKQTKSYTCIDIYAPGYSGMRQASSESDKYIAETGPSNHQIYPHTILRNVLCDTLKNSSICSFHHDHSHADLVSVHERNRIPSRAPTPSYRTFCSTVERAVGLVGPVHPCASRYSLILSFH